MLLDNPAGFRSHTASCRPSLAGSFDNGHLGRAHQGHVALPPSFETVKTVPFGCGDSMIFFVALGGWEVRDSWGVILFVTRSSRTCMAVHENG
jgi:hypothetical protein